MVAYQRVYNQNFGELGIEVAKRWPEWRVLKQRGKQRDTLGVALSGGGYRSAIFNYGVLRGLHKIGVLPRADYLSVVSGGSWIGMDYATTNFLHDWKKGAQILSPCLPPTRPGCHGRPAGSPEAR